MRRHTRRGDKYARRDHRPDPRARPDRASPLAGCGPRPLQEGPQDLARPARPGLAPTGRGGGHETVSPGSRTPPAKRSPQPGRSWTPTRVASLAGAKLDECRRRIQHETTGRRDRADDPLHRARRTLDCWMFFGQCLFVLQAAFVKSRKSLSTSSGVRYPRAE